MRIKIIKSEFSLTLKRVVTIGEIIDLDKDTAKSLLDISLGEVLDSDHQEDNQEVKETNGKKRSKKIQTN